MKKPAFSHAILFWCLCALMMLQVAPVSAFSLLGPYEPWMISSNAFHQDNDIGGETIGGPMDLTNEYRWNVPVVTYAFDESFLDFFGSNGVAAVEDAIQILNNLPPADEIAATNYLFDSRRINFVAGAENLQDLKSITLSLLLEHMGLASPTRSIAVIRQWTPMFLTNTQESSWPPGTFPTNLLARNFDPETLAATHTVDGMLYELAVFDIVVPSPLDPLDDTFSAVADADISGGAFYTGLTYDDVGGLRYLLSTNNFNFEPLLASVHGTGPNAGSWVTNALRPGVGKVTWVSQQLDSPLLGNFLPITNQFVDTYISNGVVMQQQLERVITEPDVVFSVAQFTPSAGPGALPLFRRTSTTNWLSCSTNPGPGIITPGISIVFNKIGTLFVSDSTTSEDSFNDRSAFWARFDDSTNAPVIFPVVGDGINQLNLTLWLTKSDSPSFQHTFSWSQAGTGGQTFIFETSTDLVNWNWLLFLNNDGIDCTYWNQLSANEHRFYRLIPAP